MRIVVAVDGSEASIVGLEYVAALPLGPADEVLLVSVAEHDARLARQVRRRHERHLAVLLDAAWAARRAAAPGRPASSVDDTAPWTTPVRQVVRTGHPVEEIAGLAREVEADLVVVGPRGLHGAGGLLLGSVTRELLGIVTSPLLVARRPAGPPERIVLACDGSPNARRATHVLGELACFRAAAVSVVAVVAVPALPVQILGQDRWLALLEADRHAAGGSADEAVRQLVGLGWTATASVRVGDPAHELVAAARARRAGLIVLGARGTGGFRGLLVGRVAQRVVARGTCSVLVVPPATSPAGDGDSAGGGPDDRVP